ELFVFQLVISIKHDVRDERLLGHDENHRNAAGYRLGFYSNVFKKTHLVDGSDLIPDRLCGKAIPFLQGNPATDSRNLYSFVPLNPNGFDQRPWFFSPDCTWCCSSQQRHPEA